MDLEQWTRVRRKVLMEGRSKRSVMAGEGIHWETLQKMLSHAQPPGYRQVTKRRRGIEAHREWIQGILDADRELPRKQRHTRKRIHEGLMIERKFKCGYTVVRDLAEELTTLQAEVFMPLVHRPGEAQVDFGHALVNEGGSLRKCPFFVMSLPCSDAFYLQVFERE